MNKQYLFDDFSALAQVGLPKYSAKLIEGSIQVEVSFVEAFAWGRGYYSIEAKVGRSDGRKRPLGERQAEQAVELQRELLTFFHTDLLEKNDWKERTVGTWKFYVQEDPMATTYFQARAVGEQTAYSFLSEDDTIRLVPFQEFIRRTKAWVREDVILFQRRYRDGYMAGIQEMLNKHPEIPIAL